jgi:hypothetical protein
MYGNRRIVWRQPGTRFGAAAAAAVDAGRVCAAALIVFDLI